MKMIFAHDHFFYHIGGQVFSPGKLPYSAFERYFNHFSEISVLSRFKNMTDISPHWVRSNGDGLSFVKLKNYSSLKNLILPDRNEDDLLKLVSLSDGIVVRLPSEIGLKVATLARKLGKPYIVEVVACPWDAMIGYGSKKSLFYAPILKWRMQKAVKDAWGALYVTDKFLQERYPNKHFNISASNVELEMSGSEVLDSRLSRIKNNKSICKLGLIGSLDSPHKGYDTAYRALSYLIESGERIELHIVGDGIKYKNLPLIEKLNLKDYIFFHGVKKSGSEIYKFLDEIDIYIQPSSQEGLPRAVIEAMSRACPVVLSSAGGMPELATFDLLHKPNDHLQMAKIIQRVNSDMNLKMRLASDNYNKAFSFDKNKLQKIRFEFFSSYKKMLQEK